MLSTLIREIGADKGVRCSADCQSLIAYRDAHLGVVNQSQQV